MSCGAIFSKRPPFFERIVLILEADRFLLSVRASITKATLKGRNPHILNFENFD